MVGSGVKLLGHCPTLWLSLLFPSTYTLFFNGFIFIFGNWVLGIVSGYFLGGWENREKTIIEIWEYFLSVWVSRK